MNPPSDSELVRRGDQGFLNEYFEGFVNAYLFDPNDIPSDAKVGFALSPCRIQLPSQMMRLETGYNADIGLYILNSNRWMIPKERLKIVHYTLGPFKPWNWWTGWVISDLKAWQVGLTLLSKRPIFSFSAGIPTPAAKGFYWYSPRNDTRPEILHLLHVLDPLSPGGRILPSVFLFEQRVLAT